MTVLQRPTEVDVRLADNGPGTSSNELAVLKKKEEVLKHRTGLGLWIVDVAMLQTAGSVQYDTDSTGATVTLRPPGGRRVVMRFPLRIGFGFRLFPSERAGPREQCRYDC
jgi:K+-sensing histidine kinase KdpD